MRELPGGAEEARRLVANLINTNFIPEARAKDAELHAVQITALDGAPAGWLVGLVIGERLIGFAQLDEAFRFRRYSSFAGAEPPAKDWLESSVVLSRAREQAGADLDFGEPFLSFDASPDRIAWVVPATGPDGTGRRLFVAGDQVFERPV
jgi:hypothetical protein